MAVSLQIQNLGMSYVDQLFSEVSLDAQGKAKIGLIGDNGSGKSTLLKILAGLEQPNTGKATWSQEAKVGYLEQEIVADTFDVSGGEKKILKITELFYGDYNALLLDEPDNHLDMDHKDWFEELVREFPGLVIVISHDRHFLEIAVDQIWHLEEQKVKAYGFSYSKFKDIYEENMESRKRLYETQEKERVRLADYVKRMRVKAAANDAFTGILHNAEKRYERWIEQMVEKPPKESVLNLQLNVQTENTKKTAVFLQNVSKTYVQNEVLKNIELHVFCGEKIAISAPNGSGKSTLLNMIVGKLEPTLGEIKIGPELKVGYYAQEHLDILNPQETMLGELQKTKPFFHYEGIAYLKRFLFREEQIVSEVRFLSGGQKSRLQLAKFLASEPDVLVLDEPTNHLDLKGVLALENFLKDYLGTLILVSHDRELVNSVVKKVYFLERGSLKS